MTIMNSRYNRRTVLKGAVVTGAAALVTPSILGRASLANEPLVVRTLGGSYEDAVTKVVFTPFTQTTGIAIQPVPATTGKLLAMHQAGTAEIDVIDIGAMEAMQFIGDGALASIDYGKWKDIDPGDLDAEARGDYYVGHTYYSAVLAYNTKVFSSGDAPRSWADFWNAERFPGPRMLADLASGFVDLEQALLADGVAPADLYPIDIQRALGVMSKIRPHIRKFWDTGALSAQMLTDQEVVMGSIWNTRAQVAIDNGAPIAIEWNGGLLRMQGWAVAKASKKQAEAQRFIEFALAPERQAALAALIPNGPTNKKAFEHISAERAAILPSNPAFAAKQIHQNVEWWNTNRSIVAKEWSKWLLENR
ncbi:ABC transporter substrate-binding protein [Mesorhizobium sp. 1B3]|uniref:ABC transporter substrate-binding protein n=1 Tax=Mesorhizobium sp. 1B3 TaxID=3243599 RepID=UPI003D99D544